MDAEDLEGFLSERRRDLWAFCYQMLGSPFDADDAVQDVGERAWRARDGFDPARGTPAGWVFRIARNVCVDRLRGAARRTLPRDLGSPDLEVGAPLVPRFDVPWLQPAPSSWLGDDDTADAVVRGSEVRLAVTALLQTMPAQQRAAFVLREVLGYPAADAAAALDLSVPAVNSALQRARARLAQSGLDGQPSPRPVERSRVEQYAQALAAGDAAALEKLVAADVVLEMPPVPQWSRGREPYRAFMEHLFGWRGRRWETRPVSANHQPGLLAYLVGDEGPRPHTVQLFTAGPNGLLDHVLVYQDPRLFGLFE
ncbi:RNA polymerase subunit sigma-70 [Actinocatenispora sera]|uniref:RNA polymerase sigma factor n=1 Tax=Actinocatenispora sera TaxID=390989 RepID=A0A810L2B1_9ACTN|nr:RNA polymerase subunit sigma-70 [Actinocatenispora sera]BCJ28586.1 RNA polymerase sigma factor [Actinocatenispora sera]